MGNKLINRKNRKKNAGAVSDLATFEDGIVDLDSTGVLPELECEEYEDVAYEEYEEETYEEYEYAGEDAADEELNEDGEVTADEPLEVDEEFDDKYFEETCSEPTEDEYLDIDDGLSAEKPEITLHLNKKAIYASVIAAACVAVLIAGFFVVKNVGKKHAAPAGSYVNGIFVSEAMQGAGNEISNIGMIGERGLIAALDARIAAGMALQDLTDTGEGEENSGYDEAEFTTSVTVGIELVTVKSDLKVRILNSSTGKLIPNVPFKVTVTGPGGSGSVWTDDDLDGIIYKTSLEEGRYTVHVEALEGDKYSGYTWPADKSANVRSTISYTGVDVKNEVKKANQVNESAEDTASRGGTSLLDASDTVEFVESTSSPEYKEISKDTITNPAATLILQSMDRDSSFPYFAVTGTENSDTSDTGDEKKSDDANGENGNESGKDDKDTGEDKKEDEIEQEKPTVKLTLSSSSQRLNVGDSFTFTASYTLTAAPGCELTVSSSDSSVAGASITDKTITVKAEKAGTADITVTATTTVSDTVKDKATDSAKCTVTVVSVDMSAALKDNSGNEVYVLENGKYRRATNADYSKFDKFYIISGTKYTGWQTIGGSTYYYDKDGKAVTGTQIIQGVTYQFSSDGKMSQASGVLGIDVSKWNGNIDWAAVKAAGVQYVIIRIGYRGSTAGALIDDSKFTTNIAGAKAAGLGVGVYFVTQAVNDVEAVYEASMVIERLRGYSLEYPVFLDVEPSGGRGDLIDKNTRTAVCIAFCETIRNAGYTPGIYANKSWFETKMNASQLSSYKIWVAHYSAVCGYTGRYDYWQYTDKGRVLGISGNVDYNLKYT